MAAEIVRLPGGGAYGRSAQPDVRNPILALPAARAILALPIEQRRPLGLLLRQLAAEADAKAEDAWRHRKGIMAAYWRAVCTYAKHIARAVDPQSDRQPAPRQAEFKLATAPAPATPSASAEDR